jgi:hypothetical protein
MHVKVGELLVPRTEELATPARLFPMRCRQRQWPLAYQVSIRCGRLLGHPWQGEINEQAGDYWPYHTV